MSLRYRKPGAWTGGSAFPSGVIGDRSATSVGLGSRRGSGIQRRAKQLRKKRPPAQLRLEEILNELYGGKLRGQFTPEWPFCRSVLDFFFHEQRLGIEVDGPSHLHPRQRRIDAQKTAACEKLDITLVRITNAEVYGDRRIILQKLRMGWLRAAQRARANRGRYRANDATHHIPLR